MAAGEEETAVHTITCRMVAVVAAASRRRMTRKEGVHFSSDLALCGNAELHDGDMAEQKEVRHQSRSVQRELH